MRFDSVLCKPIIDHENVARYSMTYKAKLKPPDFGIVFISKTLSNGLVLQQLVFLLNWDPMKILKPVLRYSCDGERPLDI